MNDKLKDQNRRIAALTPEKRALYYHILEQTELLSASDLLGLTNYRAGWAE